MDYQNRFLLLIIYKTITIIDDNISWLVIVINNDDELTVPIIVNSDIANKMITMCMDNSLIGIKGKIDDNEIGFDSFLFNKFIYIL